MYTTLKGISKEVFSEEFDYLKHFETIFYGVENRNLILINIEYNLISNSNEEIVLDSAFQIFDKSNSKSVVYVSLGEHDVADSLIKSGILVSMGEIPGLLYALTKQAEAEPIHVSAPFEILTLFSNDKIRWNLNPLNCQ